MLAWRPAPQMTRLHARVKGVTPLRQLQRKPTTASSVLAHVSCSGRRDYHVAVVGSGPAGFYTTKYLFKQAPDLCVDMFERLPTPFGLVRFGVAPDHPEVKNVTNDFTQVAASPGFRFLGNVEVGKDVTLPELQREYDAVIMCTGAEGERMLGIPGEDLSGVMGAPAFVKWYNGHPDYVGLNPLQHAGESAVVLGQGNVAIDIARILTRPPNELHSTDIHAGALAQIGEWQRDGLRTVHLVGRRGFVQAAFTNAELRELLTISDEVLPIVDPDELALCRNPASEQELAKNRMKKRSVDILSKMAENFALKDTTSKRIIWLRFLWSPAAVLPCADGKRVAGVRLDRNELHGEPGKQAAVKSSNGLQEDVACGIVLRSVGFQLTPMQGVPLNDRKRVPHIQGRVTCPTEAGDAGGGLYVSGWAKRGPQGTVATNIPDAQETAKRVLQDLKERGPPSGIDATNRGPTMVTPGTRVVSFADWQRLEAEEARRGSDCGKSASKFTDVGEMLQVLG